MLGLALRLPLLWLYDKLDALGMWAHKKEGELLDEAEYWIDRYPTWSGKS